MVRGTVARWAGAAAASMAVAACVLSTDFDDFSRGTTDAALPDSAVVVPHADASSTPDAALVASCPGVDLRTDAQNCGACGKSCLGGTCSAGACGPATIAKGFTHPLGVAFAGGHVFVGDEKGITQCDPDGTSCSVVVPDVVAHYLFASGMDLYFTDSSASSVDHWTIGSAAPPTQLKTGIGELEGVAASDTDVYYARYTDLASSGGIYKVTSSSSALVRAWDHPEGLNWANGTLFVGSDGTNTAAELLPDGGQVVLAQGGGTTGVFVVGDDAYITRQGQGEILHVSISTLAAQVLATGFQEPSGIVFANGAVYWADYDDGALDVVVP